MKVKRTVILLAAVLFILSACFLIVTKKISVTPIFAAQYPVRGVDVSHYQGTVDWRKLEEQQIAFAYIKATEGSSHVDGEFANNWKNAGATGLYVGAYHFFSFDSEAATQAELYIRTVGELSGKLVPAVDVEYYGDKRNHPPESVEVVGQLREFLWILEEHYQVRPVIYTTYEVYGKYVEGEFDEYPLWIRNVYFPPVDKADRWKFWQYSDTAVLDGYRGSEKCIDLNVFCGTLEGLGEFCLPR